MRLPWIKGPSPEIEKDERVKKPDSFLSLGPLIQGNVRLIAYLLALFSQYYLIFLKLEVKYVGLK